MADNSDRNTLRSRNSTDTVATCAEADAYLASIRQRGPTASATGAGRLAFALDATASRQVLWRMACQLQAKMFEEVKAIGGLSVQLIYYRGLDECRASKWISQPDHLSGLMEKIECRMGHTQIGKVLAHTKRETQLLKVSALVFVGDAMEEDADKLAKDASELGRLGTRAFMFQEGSDRQVENVFRGIADLSHGAFGRFDAGAAQQLGEFLRAVAAFVAGGMPALAARKDASGIKLLAQMSKG